MKAITLHDYDEDVIGQILVRDKDDFGQICNDWDQYLQTEPVYADIYDFVNLFPKRDYEVLDMEFYQPRRGRGIEV